MDLLLLLWIAFMGVIPPFLSGALLAYLGWIWGNRQGKKQYEMAKQEIRDYIKGEFMNDLAEAVKQQINGALGPIARGGSQEARVLAAQYAQANPGIASLLTGVAAKGAARWLGKQLGVPRDTVDALAGGPIGPIGGFGTSRRKGDPASEPVTLPGPFH